MNDWRGRRALVPGGVWLAIFALGAGCGDDTSPARDAAAGKDAGGTREAGVREASARADTGPPADAAACRKSGQGCGGEKGACCAGLECCSGMPVPPGEEYCGVTCPISDRNLKYGFEATGGDLLGKLAKLPISTWSYNNEPPSVRHIGPTAQDFKAVFGVGASDKAISPVDAEGVALAALQILDRKVEALSCEVAAARAENVRLRAELRRLRGR